MSSFEAFVSLELPRRSALLTSSVAGYDGDPNLPGAPAILQGAPIGTWYLRDTPETYYRRTSSGWSVSPIGEVSSSWTPGFIRGCQTSYISASQVGIAAGKLVSSDDSVNITVSSPLTADLSASGANGLDTGSESADTHYSVWVIADSSGTNPVAALLSTSSAAPTLPAGYDLKRRVGWVRNNSSSNIMPFEMELTNGSDRLFRYMNTFDTIVADTTDLTFTDADCSEFIPPTVRLLEVFVYNIVPTSDTANTITLRAKGTSWSTPPSQFAIEADVSGAEQGGASGSQLVRVHCSASQVIQYSNSNAAGGEALLCASGYIDSL